MLLIGAGSRAKVTDFGMSKLTELNPRMTGLTKCPGTPAYMSPEALLDPPVYTEKLDCFQAGVLMIQTITHKFPDPGPAMNRVRDARYPTGWTNVPIPEVERRQNHLSHISQTHPMLRVAVDCLKDMDSERPSAQQICQYLSALKEAPEYGQSLEGWEGERDGEVEEREELIQQLRQENQEREREVRERDRDIKCVQSQLQQKKREVRKREREIRERENYIEHLQSQLQRMEGEVKGRQKEVLEREREIIEREGDIQHLRSQLEKEERVTREKGNMVTLKVEEIRLLQRVIQDQSRLLQEKDQTIHQLQQTQQSAPSYTCLVSGPGLQSATANHPTHVIVEVSDSSGRPCSLQQNVTAKVILQSTSQATPTSHGRWLWSKKTLSRTDQPPAIDAAVTMVSLSQYEVSYTAVRRGQHKLHIQVNGIEINGSPFTITMYPDPTQLGSPVRVATDLSGPYGIAFNSHGKMAVTECRVNRFLCLMSEDRGFESLGHMVTSQTR